jgi:hypothetical protein
MYIRLTWVNGETRREETLNIGHVSTVCGAATRFIKLRHVCVRGAVRTDAGEADLRTGIPIKIGEWTKRMTSRRTFITRSLAILAGSMLPATREFAQALSDADIEKLLLQTVFSEAPDIKAAMQKLDSGRR